MAWDNEWVYEDDRDFQNAEAANFGRLDPEDGFDAVTKFLRAGVEADDDYEDDEPWDGFQSDAEADADVLRMAGMGTDEDYGYYGDDSYMGLDD